MRTGTWLMEDGCSPLCMFECGNLTGTWESYWSTTIRWNLVDDGAGGLSGSGYLTNSPGGLGGPLSGTRSGTTLSLFWTINGGDFTLTGTVDACGSINLQPLGLTYRLDTLVCGDGRQEAGEECDDGNFNNDDACSVACRLSYCRNGLLDSGEECDDGNYLSGDGCENNCTRPRCGNGILDVGEQCDDGNPADGDGCDRNCGIPGCPDGVIGAGEECDDGNLNDNDSCERNCRLPTCGDAISGPGEQCDDGNDAACDGCFECQTEVDVDRDHLLGTCDDCPQDYNPSQRDRDNNGVGDACDAPVSLETPAGMGVVLQDNPGSVPGLTPERILTLTISYAQVQAPGVTLIRTLEAPVDSLIASDFKVSALGALLHLETSAVISGTIRVCAEYDDSDLAADEEAALVFLHEESGVFVNRTSSLDTAANVLCADVTSFSRFALGAGVGTMIKQRMTASLDMTRQGADRLNRLQATLLPSRVISVDPSMTGVRLTVLRDGEEALTRSLPGPLWQSNRSRTAFRFDDAEGTAASGITKARIAVSRSGAVRVRFVGRPLDLSRLQGSPLTVKLDLGPYTFVGSPACLLRLQGDRAAIKCKSD